MRFFVQSTPATKPKTKNITIIARATAMIFVILAVAQLFKYEEFPALLAKIWMNDITVKTHLSAALIVTAEVFALPFLLSLRLSPLMRLLSMLSGWLVVFAWFVSSLQGNIWGASQSALLGATVPLTQGWWSVLFCLALGVLVAWVSWGMWPTLTHGKKSIAK